MSGRERWAGAGWLVLTFASYCGEFDNFGAVMSVSEDLLCSFELLKPLDGAALKKEMTKSKRKR